MASVTVQSPLSGDIVSVPFDSAENLKLAQQVAGIISTRGGRWNARIRNKY